MFIGRYKELGSIGNLKVCLSKNVIDYKTSNTDTEDRIIRNYLKSDNLYLDTLEKAECQIMK